MKSLDENNVESMENDEIKQPSQVESAVNHSENEPQAEIVCSSEWLKENTKIQGWLSFFLFVLVAGGILSAGYPIVTFNFDDYAGNYCLAYVDILTGFILLGIASYTFYAFLSRKPNAVFWGEVYVILVFGSNFLNLWAGGDDDNILHGTKQMVRSLVWSIIWLLYLIFSKQVKVIIPKSFRKISATDIVILVVAVILPVILFFVGWSQVNSIVDSRAEKETELINSVLSDDQRTDGRVVFTIPSGFTCDQNDVDLENGLSLTLFLLNNDETGSNCTICSDYDTDKSQTNFDEYLDAWKDSDATTSFFNETIDSGEMSVNGNDCLYSIVRYDVDGVDVYWRFYLLFNDETGKVFVASFYDTGDSTDYVYELLESVMFK